MYTYSYTYIHVYIYTYIHVGIYIHIYIYICINIYRYKYRYIFVYIYIYMYIYIDIYMYICSYMCIFIYVYIVMNACIYIFVPVFTQAELDNVWWVCELATCRVLQGLAKQDSRKCWLNVNLLWRLMLPNINLRLHSRCQKRCPFQDAVLALLGSILMALLGLILILSHAMYQLIGCRKSIPPPNRQLIV